MTDMEKDTSRSGRIRKHNLSRRRNIIYAIVLLAIVAAKCILLFGSCEPKASHNNAGSNDEEYDVHDYRINIKVHFVPLDGVSPEYAKKVSEQFYNNFAAQKWEGYSVNTLSHKASPASCLNDSKSRLRGEKMIKWLETEFKDSARSYNVGRDYFENFIIGVTDKDISTSIHGRDDYGILGLSFLGKGKACVISTYRLKRRKDLWKLAVHEFCHGFYGCPHCPNDDPHCIMADAKGGNPHFEIKDSLCLHCANVCLIGD